MFFLYPRVKKWDMGITINGFLGGLVAITCPCYWVNQLGAVVIGTVAGIAVVLAVDLLEWVRMDDPIGAWPVHGACGIWGTLSLGLFATGQYFLPTPTGADTSAPVTGLFYGGGGSQLWAQFAGSFSVTMAVVVLAVVLMYVTKLTRTLRVPEAGELEGIDIHEHGTPAYHPEFQFMSITLPGVTNGSGSVPVRSARAPRGPQRRVDLGRDHRSLTHRVLDLRAGSKVYPPRVSTSYRIAEVARRSGFSPATLRYYEGIGLLPPPDRTEAGYRLYDDHTLHRLAFIARAKQLGCTLEEIADLSTAWDGGRCGPVQDRLRALVAAKRSDAHGRVAELLALSAELERAATALEQHRPEGQCDDRCGCTSHPVGATSVVLTAKVDRIDERAGLSCTLEPGRTAHRLDEWQALLARVERRRPLGDGLRLEFTPDVALGDLVALVAAEHDCCRFFAFAVTVDARGVGLEVRSSAEALPVVHALFGLAA